MSIAFKWKGCLFKIFVNTLSEQPGVMLRWLYAQFVQMNTKPNRIAFKI